MAQPPNPIPIRPTPHTWEPPKPLPTVLPSHDDSGERKLLNYIEVCKFGHFQVQLETITSNLKVPSQHSSGPKRPTLTDQDTDPRK